MDLLTPRYDGYQSNTVEVEDIAFDFVECCDHNCIEIP